MREVAGYLCGLVGLAVAARMLDEACGGLDEAAGGLNEVFILVFASFPGDNFSAELRPKSWT